MDCDTCFDSRLWLRFYSQFSPYPVFESSKWRASSAATVLPMRIEFAHKVSLSLGKNILFHSRFVSGCTVIQEAALPTTLSLLGHVSSSRLSVACKIVPESYLNMFPDPLLLMCRNSVATQSSNISAYNLRTQRWESFVHEIWSKSYTDDRVLFNPSPYACEPLPMQEALHSKALHSKGSWSEGFHKQCSRCAARFGCAAKSA